MPTFPPSILMASFSRTIPAVRGNRAGSLETFHHDTMRNTSSTTTTVATASTITASNSDSSDFSTRQGQPKDALTTFFGDYSTGNNTYLFDLPHSPAPRGQIPDSWELLDDHEAECSEGHNNDSADSLRSSDVLSAGNDSDDSSSVTSDEVDSTSSVAEKITTEAAAAAEVVVDFEATTGFNWADDESDDDWVAPAPMFAPSVKLIEPLIDGLSRSSTSQTMLTVTDEVGTDEDDSEDESDFEARFQPLHRLPLSRPPLPMAFAANGLRPASTRYRSLEPLLLPPTSLPTPELTKLMEDWRMQVMLGMEQTARSRSTRRRILEEMDLEEKSALPALEDDCQRHDWPGTPARLSPLPFAPTPAPSIAVRSPVVVDFESASFDWADDDEDDWVAPPKMFSTLR